MIESPTSGSKWQIALILCLSHLSLGLSISAVTIAIPSIMASLGASLNQIHWILTGYLIARTVLMPSVGWLGSRMGNRSLFILGAGAFTGTSFLCSLAWDANSLVLFRILQAAGAGALYSISTAIMYESFPTHQRGTAIGLLNGSWATSFYVGPPIGGYLTQYLNWRAIFYVNVLVGVFSILGAYCLFPKKSTESGRKTFDLIGFLTFASGTVALLVAMSEGQQEGWGSPLIVFFFGASVLFLCSFVVAELRTSTPFLDLRCFKSLQFCLANLLNFFRVLGFRGANFLLSLFLQRSLNFSPLQAGLLLLPGAVMQVFAPLAGILTDRIGLRIPIVAGFGILVFAAYGLSTVSPWSNIGLIIVSIALYSGGQSFLNTPLTTAVLRSVPETKVKMGTGVLSMIRGLGEAFAVVVASLLLERKTFLNLTHMTPGQEAYLSEVELYDVSSRLQMLLVKAGDHIFSLRTKARFFLSYILLSEAITRAYQDLFLLIAALNLCLSVVSLLFLPKNKREKEAVGST